MEGIDTAGHHTAQHITATSRIQLAYNSIQDCHDKIINFIRNHEHRTDIVAQNMLDMFEVPDKANVFHSLSNVIEDVVW
jgi:hypothetical protein